MEELFNLICALIFNLTSRYFWLLAMIVTVMNALIFRKRSRQQENPSLEKGYLVLFLSSLLFMNIPWMIMGVGCTVGGIPSVWHYFKPRDGNSYVWAFFASVFALWVSGTFWIFFKSGAHTLARHLGTLVFMSWSKEKEVTSPALIKLFWLVSLAGGIGAVLLMWFMEMPIPNGR